MNETETRTCKRCKEKYSPAYRELLGIRMLRGNGYCPDCAQAVYDEMLAQEEAQRQLKIVSTRKQRRETCGIPDKFMNEDFSTFKKGWQDEAAKTCWDYAKNYPMDRQPKGYPSLYLWSTISWGVGKSHLSAAICHRLLDRWKGDEQTVLPRVLFLSEPELFRRIQATFSFSREEKQLRESEDDIIKSIIYADLAIIDDICKEKRRDMDFVRRTLFSIIDGRYKNNLPIIITSNHAPLGLKEYVGDANFDRIWEMVDGKNVKMDGQSFRRSGTKWK